MVLWLGDICQGGLTYACSLLTSRLPGFVQVSPFHAAILLQFKERSDWPAAQLASELGVTPEVLRRRVVFWINKGLAITFCPLYRACTSCEVCRRLFTLLIQFVSR